MRTREVIAILKKHPPDTAIRMLRRRGARRLGSGISRTAYSIPGTNKVVKVAYWADGGQTHHEIKTIEAISTKKKFHHLRRYLPKMFYHDLEKGVVILERLDTKNRRLIREKLDAFENRLRHIKYGNYLNSDLHEENVGLTKRGQIKVLDLGCVYL